LKTAWIVAAAAMAMMGAPVHATEPLWLFVDETAEGLQLTYADCNEASRWVECEQMNLACDGDFGSFGIAHGAGLVVRAIETDDRNLMALTFSVGQVALTAEALSINVQPNMISGGWLVSFPSYDMARVFAAMAEQPAAKIGVSVAGHAFDLTPRPEDRETMREFGEKCAAILASGE
jgi:hypothetical protein